MSFPLPMMVSGAAAPELPGTPLLWLDAADDATIVTTGSNIDIWINKGSGVFLFTPATSHAAPQRVANGVSFSASSVTNPGLIQALASIDAGSNLIVGPVNRTVYAVVEVASFVGASGGCVLATTNGATGNTNFSTFMTKEVITANTQGPWLWERGGVTSGYWAHQAGTLTDALHLIIGKKDGAGVRYAAIDNAAFTTGGSTSYTASGINRCMIGVERVASGGSPANPFNGIIRELVIYDSTLSAEDDAQARAYFNARWGIY